jgi:ubiquitin-protein ligase
MRDGKLCRSMEKVWWLSLFKLSTVLDDIESLLRRLNVSQDKPAQWWWNLANKARFGHQESFLDVIHRLDFHHYALHMTIRTFNR